MKEFRIEYRKKLEKHMKAIKSAKSCTSDKELRDFYYGMEVGFSISLDAFIEIFGIEE